MDKQKEMEHLVGNLEGYKPKNPDKIKSREEVLKNAERFFEERNLIVYAFEENIFPLLKEKSLKKNGQKKKEKNIFLQKKDQILLLRKKRA